MLSGPGQCRLHLLKKYHYFCGSLTLHVKLGIGIINTQCFLRLGRTWEVATWKNTLGKLPLGKNPLGKYLTSFLLLLLSI